MPPPITLGLAPGELDALTCYTRLSFATLTRDGKVDRSDVQLIFNARGHQAPVPGDPRDADEDSVITVKRCPDLCAAVYQTRTVPHRPNQAKGEGMKKLIWLGVVVGVSGLLGASPALAISLDLVPSSPTVFQGHSVDVAVVISGLVAGGPPSVGAFDLTVSFDPAILSPTSVTFGRFLGNPDLLEALAGFNFLAGFVEFAEVSLLSSAELDTLQPASFTLATLSFTALESATTTLAFSQITVDDAFGNLLLGTKVSEPTSLLLIASGLVCLGLMAARKRCRR